MVADRWLGRRRAVVFGGLLMAAGHLTMTIQRTSAFYLALALIIVGCGLFKPNVSAMVGALYGERDPRRDSGFTLFYMGINLGGALASLLCGYVGETFGWHYGFGLAAIGMLVGLAVFVVPARLARALILGGALLTAFSMIFMVEGTLLLVVDGFVGLALVASGALSFVALSRGGLPHELGQPPDPERLHAPWLPGVSRQTAVFAGALLAVPVFALLVASNRDVRVVPDAVFTPLTQSTRPLARVAGAFLSQMSTLPGLILLLVGFLAAAFLLRESLRAGKVERERLWVMMALIFASMLFWSFFEQGSSSINNFTDRNVDRVQEARIVTARDIGRTETITVNQEQLGEIDGDPALKDAVVAALRAQAERRGVDAHSAKVEKTLAFVRAEPALTLTGLDALRDIGKTEVPWTYREDNVGMGVGGAEIPASTFRSANPIFILLFGLVLAGLWSWLGARGREPSTPVKFALGLAQLGLGFVVLWYSTRQADARGMVGIAWLLLSTLLFTTGELCLSPVGLSMITKLSPARLVSTAMGCWFMANAFSGLLSSIIAGFTRVGGPDGGMAGIPVPAQTVHLYGDVFGAIALGAGVIAVAIFAVSPVLARGMHEEAIDAVERAA